MADQASFPLNDVAALIKGKSNLNSDKGVKPERVSPAEAYALSKLPTGLAALIDSMVESEEEDSPDKDSLNPNLLGEPKSPDSDYSFAAKSLSGHPEPETENPCCPEKQLETAKIEPISRQSNVNNFPTFDFRKKLSKTNLKETFCVNSNY